LERWQVIVVGGGPSGSFAARTCAERGLRVLLIEKEHLPRYKPCGGGISQKTLHEIGPLPQRLVERECRGARLFSPALHAFEYKMPSVEKVATMSFRDVLDQYLVEEAIRCGAALHDGETVCAFASLPQGAVVTTTLGSYLADLVIAGDGASSSIARQAGLLPSPRDDGRFGVTIEAEIAVGAANVERIMGDPELVELYFPRSWGYRWIFPKREHLSVGIGGLLSKLRKPKDVFAGFLDDLARLKGFDFKSRVEKVHGWTIPIGGYERPTVADRLLLAGDAAGYLDPFLGEGIYYAVRSGKLAGQTAVEALREGRTDGQFLSQYKDRCDRAFGDDLRWALRFAHLCYRFVDLFLRAFECDQQLPERFLRCTMMEAGGYRNFMLWLWPHLPVTAARMLRKQGITRSTLQGDHPGSPNLTGWPVR
jgi:geranylgeranyl reductase family protein